MGRIGGRKAIGERKGPFLMAKAMTKVRAKRRKKKEEKKEKHAASINTLESDCVSSFSSSIRDTPLFSKI